MSDHVARSPEHSAALAELKENIPGLPARATGQTEDLRLPDLDTRAAALFERGFGATTGQWNAATKTFFPVEDLKTQLAFLTLYMAYRYGLPVQRVVKLTGNFKDRHAELMEVAATPSGRDMLLCMGAVTPEWIAANVPNAGQVAEVRAAA